MSRGRALKKDLLPLLGVFASFVFFALSTARYPGGYDWTNHTISRLFQCLTGTLSNAAMYYGDVLYGLLPLVQKTSLAMWVGWLLVLHVAESRRQDARTRSRGTV